MIPPGEWSGRESHNNHKMKPETRILKYTQKLEALKIKYAEDASAEHLRSLLEKAVKGLGSEADDEAHNEEAANLAKKETDAFVDERVKALERQLAEIKAALSASGGSTLTPEIIREIGRLGRNEVVDGIVDPTYIKPEDELPEAITFYRYGPTHNIFTIRKAGVNTALPYGLKCIKFEKSAGWTTRSGLGVQNRIVSVYITKNRKIADAIMSYHEFGKTIHIDKQKAFDTTVTGRYMDLYNLHYQSMSSQPMHVLANMASEMGIESGMGWSHHDYSVQIAERKALDGMKAERDAFESKMRAFEIDKQLLGNP